MLFIHSKNTGRAVRLPQRALQVGSAAAVFADEGHMALTHDLQQVQLLGLAGHIHDLRLVVRGVHLMYLNQVPKIVVWPV